MPNPVESIRAIQNKVDLKSRVNPDGVIFIGAVNGVSLFPLATAGVSLTYALYELSKDHNPAVVQAFAIGGLGALNTASVIAEAKALKSHEYSANLTSSAVYGVTKRPFLSSISGHALNYAKNAIVPLVGLVGASHPEIIEPISSIAGHALNYAKDVSIPYEVAGSIIMTSCSITLNNLILHDKTRPFVEGVERFRQFVGSKFGRGRVGEDIGIEKAA